MIKGYFETFRKYRYLLQNLISRDFKVKYRRSVFGVAWSLLNPIFMMLILSAVFSSVFRGGPGSIPFPLYLMTGQVIFTFFSEATTSANYSIVDSSHLIKKVYVPKYFFPVEKILFGFVNMIFSLAAIIVMLLIYRVPFSWGMLLSSLPLVSLLVFTIGFGLIIAALCVFFRDLKHLYSILIIAWMYLTPIIYHIDFIAGSWIRYVVYANPLTWYIEYFRACLLGIPASELAFAPGLMSAVCFGWAAVSLAAGLLVFHRTQDRFILYI
jgi:ABC-2 type transport system permease protein